MSIFEKGSLKLKGNYLPLAMATLAVCLLAVLSAMSFAQGTRGTISGKVTDPNGAVVPGATVRLTNIAKQIEVRNVQTNGEG
ncbi:MAG: carboxypeptidase regulatory-like domain-containing protein, partial [Deltaproteobacteria bacterium]|nr:carboxypeptidase regulatory-like domain-containing protein [Deltaproteobacteria bacterium]